MNAARRREPPAGALDHDAYQRLVRSCGPPWMAWFALGERDEAEIGFAVHAAFHGGRLVMVRHRGRRRWELPGGRREAGEAILETARRELEEECGAPPAEQRPWCGYSVRLGDRLSHGLLCLSRLDELPGPPPSSEIGEARALEAAPAQWCYPHIQGRILEALVAGADRLPWGARPPTPGAALLSILSHSPSPLGRIPAPPQNPEPGQPV